MPTPYDVPATAFIERLTQFLKEEVNEVTPPAWTSLIKTGSHVQRPPQNPDWWFVRCASVIRKIYMKGPIGVERLRTEYGGRIDRGVKPEHSRKGGGTIIRTVIHQLQKAGLVESYRNKGRVVTSEGRRVLDRLATQIKKDLEKSQPELTKY